MATIAEKKDSLKKLYTELEAGQKEMEAGNLSQARGEELEAKAKEAETLQKDIDEYERITSLAKKGKEFEPVIPATKKQENGVADTGSKVVGYVKLGDAFVKSDAYKNFIKSGLPKQAYVPFDAKSITDIFIPITQKMVEQKAIPDFGADVIRPDRISEMVRVTEHQRLRMRDVLNVATTDSNSIEYVTLVEGPDAAAPVAEGDLKPEASSEWDTVQTPVRTLAVWQPVTEQQLQDAGQLTSMINTELVFDIKRLEERQFLYGSGAGENLLGIFNHPTVPGITRTLPGGTPTTNIDRIRMGMTDVAIRGYDPNAVVIHPYDWEEVVLAKGTDNRYVWAAISTDTGPRIWGVSVVECVGAQRPNSTQRHLLVGDFIRAATVWDRQQANVAIGWINDQFVRNMRTIRAEERLAFGIKRPYALAKYETETAGS